MEHLTQCLGHNKYRWEEAGGGDMDGSEHLPGK